MKQKLGKMINYHDLFFFQQQCSDERSIGSIVKVSDDVINRSLARVNNERLAVQNLFEIKREMRLEVEKTLTLQVK